MAKGAIIRVAALGLLVIGFVAGTVVHSGASVVASVTLAIL